MISLLRSETSAESCIPGICRLGGWRCLTVRTLASCLAPMFRLRMSERSPSCQVQRECRDAKSRLIRQAQEHVSDQLGTKLGTLQKLGNGDPAQNEFVAMDHQHVPLIWPAFDLRRIFGIYPVLNFGYKIVSIPQKANA
jgi:hypothetical protein